tara:strand:+ start:64 stop:321 length:258 start_codon:yes stop_codon:yes gene_type:complete
MAEATKITKPELEELQVNIRNTNDFQMQIGNLEIQKASLLAGINKSRESLVQFQEKLKDKYGDVVINITNGNLKPRENGEADKKN